MKTMDNDDGNESDEDIWSYNTQKRPKLSKAATQSDAKPKKASSSSNIALSQLLPRPKIKSKSTSNLGAATQNCNTNRRKSVRKLPMTQKQSDSTGSQKTNRSVLKVISATQGSDSRSPKSHNKAAPLSSTQAHPPSQPATSKTPNNRQKASGNCPFCQMPLCALSVAESPRWHVTECMDLPFITKTECPNGISCDSTIPSHYRKYTHTVLANARSGPQATAGEGTTTLKSSNTKQNNTQSILETTSNENSDQMNRNSGPKQLENGRTILEHSEIAGGASDDATKMKSRRSLLGTFNEQTFHIVNKVTPGNHNHHPGDTAPCDTRCDEDDNNSEPDIFAERLLTGENSVTSLRDNVSHMESKEDSRDVSDMLADALCENSNGSNISLVNNNRNLIGFFHNADEVSDSELLALTGESRTTEKSLTLTPLSPIITPISAQKQFSSIPPPVTPLSPIITPISAQKQFSSIPPPADVETPQKLSQPGRISQRTPSSKYNTSHKAKLPRSSKKETVSKQASMLSFFKPTVNNVKKVTAPLNLISKTSESGVSTLKLDIGSSKPSVENSLVVHVENEVQCETGIETSGNEAMTQKRWGMYRKPANSDSTTFNAGNNKKPAKYGASSNFQRACPFYKKIPGTPFTVDAFRYGSVPGCSAYFLSHFHYDHYCGLTKHFQHPIFCSKVTANLVEKKIKVDTKYLHPLPMDRPQIVEGVEVTLLEANHCPGSVLLLFKVPNGQVVLHTGDFRANEYMESLPQLEDLHVNQLYLDTTYCDPSYAFPPQSDVVTLAVRLATDFLYENPNGLIAVGSYTIGKERIFQAIAEALNCKICVTREKKTILDCLEDSTLQSKLTLTGSQAKVHVLPMKKLNFQELSAYLEGYKLQYDRVLAFEPTGWTHSKKSTDLNNIRPKINKERVTLYGVPYSEHSSYTEMKRFVQFLRPDKILPTVNNGNPQSRKKMESLFSQWLAEENNSFLKQSALSNWLKK